MLRILTGFNVFTYTGLICILIQHVFQKLLTEQGKNFVRQVKNLTLILPRLMMNSKTNQESDALKDQIGKCSI